ncbi:MAG: preprotein translocase subunit SecA [Candidatus Omnitrophica bacterium]|nr:preprotein translocase subunit SecA [Candidatus Omnitrophota bacterium]
MLGWFKNRFLKTKQSYLNKKFPGLNIHLHQELPLVSINKIVELSKQVYIINQLEPQIAKLSDYQLRQKTEIFKEHIQLKAKKLQPQIDQLQEAYFNATIEEEKEKLKEKIKEKRNQIFEEILPEAFAVVREAAKRTIDLRHFDVQILGGIVLHQGKIAEMATGEGKTLVATLPAYLNALLGKGVHIITVNDYLARRDREWMGPIYEFLGLTVGVIQHDMDDQQRKEAYNCDITYGTNNEFGFDYLRDNMKYRLEDLVQRPFYYAIVDEVDSILIDEARTPLIISGPTEESTDKYYTAKRIADQLKGRIITEREEIYAKYKGEDLTKGFDYIADEKSQTISLTEEGENKACKFWNIDGMHTLETMEYRHHTIQALRAKEFFKRDVDYVVKDGQVIIVDEFTGRLMPGRRWSDGLHQAIEAKEGLKIERENQTLATITFQNYFRMYEKLAGMTGTAFTEAQEFKAIYKLEVIVIPTNRPLIRTNYSDCIYKTEREKFSAIVEEITQLYKKKRPVLVGTISIEKSEMLSEMLKRRGIPHQVLNAKYHELEAQIIAQAGRLGAVTIATNMAGRGTDILLGGNPEYLAKNFAKQKFLPQDERFLEEYKKLLKEFKEETQREHQEVVKLGGLHVIGTERHEARRIDNQLRGRAGRQGDPGSSRFYVSLEDDLMRLFGSDRLIKIMDTLGLQEGQVIEHPWVTKSIEIAQRRVEEHNFQIRKQLLEYDNIMNKQREIIYTQRRAILEGVSLKEEVLSDLNFFLDNLIERFLPEENFSEWEVSSLVDSINLKFGVEIPEEELNSLSKKKIKEFLYEKLVSYYEEKESKLGSSFMRSLERHIFLQIIDSKWKDHLYAMDELKEGIGLRAYGQKDPLIEYRNEAFILFQEMINKIKEEVLESIFKIQAFKLETLKGVFSNLMQDFIHPQISRFKKTPPEEPILQKDTSFSIQRNFPKVGRNDPCPCGKIDPLTGKPVKFKKCHGRNL